MSFTSLLRFKAQPGTPTRHIMLHSELKRGVLCIFSDGTAALGAGNHDFPLPFRHPHFLMALGAGKMAVRLGIRAAFKQPGQPLIFPPPCGNIAGKHAQQRQRN